jgi:replicative DNA helicase
MTNNITDFHDNLEMERRVLTCMLNSKDALAAADDILEAGNFLDPRHAVIFQAASDNFQLQQVADVTLAIELLADECSLEEAGGQDYVKELAASKAEAENFVQYANTVRDQGAVRNLLEVRNLLVTKGLAGAKNEILGLLDWFTGQIMEQIPGRHQPIDVRTITDGLHRKFEIMESQSQPPVGLPTGFAELDQLTSGLQPGQLIAIAGDQGNYQTSLLLNIADHLANREGAAIGIFSLKMSNELFIQNLACLMAGVYSLRLQHGLFKDKDWRRLAENGLHILRHAPIFMDESCGRLFLPELRSRARRMVADNNVDLILIDDLARIELERDVTTRGPGLRKLGRLLKELSRELNIPIVVTEELTGITLRKPSLDLDLERLIHLYPYADLVMLLHRPGLFCDPPDRDEPLNIIVPKNQNGRPGEFQLNYDDGTFRFKDVEVQE